MDLLATLLLGHLIADFPLQTDWVFRLKKRHIAGVALHAVIHVGATAMLIQHPLHNWPILASLGLAHFVTDWLKLRFAGGPQAPGYVIDQGVHLGVILLVARWAPQTVGLLPAWILYPTLLIATAPLIMMFVLVRASDLSQGKANASEQVQRARRRVWPSYQLSGLVAVMVVTVGWLMT